MARHGGDAPEEIQCGTATPTHNPDNTEPPLVTRAVTKAVLSDGSTARIVSALDARSGATKTVVETAPARGAKGAAERSAAIKKVSAAGRAAGLAAATDAIAAAVAVAAGGVSRVGGPSMGGGAASHIGAISAIARPPHKHQIAPARVVGTGRRPARRRRRANARHLAALEELHRLERQLNGESDEEIDLASDAVVDSEGDGEGSGTEQGIARGCRVYSEQRSCERLAVRACRRIRRLQEQSQSRARERAVRRVAATAPTEGAVKRDSAGDGFEVRHDPELDHLTPMERGRFYSSVDQELEEVEPEPITCEPADMVEIYAALTEMADAAAKAGMSAAHVARLKKILRERADAFRLTLAADPPARVKPIKYRMSPGAKPWRAPTRSYTEHQQRFLDAFVDKLLNFGYIYRNPGAVWASGVHLVKKADAKSDDDILQQYRLTVDLRGPNSVTLQSQWPLPKLSEIGAMLKGAKVFAKLDMKSAYWSLPVHKDSQELHSFRTPRGVFTPTRLSQGSCDGAQRYQAAMQEILGDLYGNGVVSYLDDILVYAETEEQLISLLEKVIVRMHRSNMKMSAKKCSFFKHEVQWCGYVFTAEGKTHSPQRVAALKNWPQPRNGGELWGFTSGMGWLRANIPAYSRRMRVLHELLQRVLERSAEGKKPRRKAQPDGSTRERPPKKDMKAATAVKLEGDLWTDEHQRAWDGAIAMLEEVTALAHPDSSKDKCVLTDASNTGWGGVLTQRAVAERDLPLLEQTHEPLAFLSGGWDRAALGYSTCDQEAMAIFRSMRKLEPMLHTDSPAKLHIYTDHKNLEYIFTPNVGELPAYTAERLERVAMYLQRFRYTIMHVPGEDNHLPDILSRWGNSGVMEEMKRETRERHSRDIYARKVRRVASGQSGAGGGSSGSASATAAVAVGGVAQREVAVRRATPLPVVPVDDYADACVGAGVRKLDWPSWRDISEAQAAASVTGAGKLLVPKLSVSDIDGYPIYKTRKDRVWIPSMHELRVRVIAIAHGHAAGHRGEVATAKNIKQLFWWKGLRSDVHNFTQLCLSCRVTRQGKVIRRPPLRTRHVLERMKLLHFDFVLIGDSSSSGNRYVLVMKDDFTCFTLLYPCKEQLASTAAQGLLWWFSTFGTVQQWQSDQGGHFVNEVIKSLAKTLHAKHHFSTAHSPWVNGTVEVVNSRVLRTLQALLAEQQMQPHEWEQLLPVVQYSINHSPMERLAGYTPAQLFTGQESGQVLEAYYRPSLSPGVVSGTIESLRGSKAIEEHMEGLVEALDQMHLEAAPTRHPPLRQQRGERAVKFAVGDYVLVARVWKAIHADKLTATWYGPMVVSEQLSPYRFRVTDVGRGKSLEVHATRLQFYCDKDRDLSPAMMDHIAHQGEGYKIAGIYNHRKNMSTGEWEVELQYEKAEQQDAEWVLVRTVVKGSRMLMRGYLRRVEVQASDDYKALAAFVEKVAPKQNREKAAKKRADAKTSKRKRGKAVAAKTAAPKKRARRNK